jgi:hypothetical protein
LYVAVVFAKRGKFQFEEIYEFGNVIKNWHEGDLTL